jgi:hypothetical protein
MSKIVRNLIIWGPRSRRKKIISYKTFKILTCGAGIVSELSQLLGPHHHLFQKARKVLVFGCRGG